MSEKNQMKIACEYAHEHNMPCRSTKFQKHSYDVSRLQRSCADQKKVLTDW